jgi:hypothetical protein
VRAWRGFFSIQSCPLPDDALLRSYLKEGAYTDCYVTDFAGPVSHAQYVTAFYTTFLFKLERLILAWFVSKPSTDDGARQLAAGSSEVFAAWRVEQRSENQLLLCDFRGATRSWLMVAPEASGGSQGTRLYFGSAVVPRRNTKTGTPRLALGFRLLLGFHKLYSVLLLYSAKSRLQAQRG